MQVEVVIVDDHVMVREGIKQLLEMDGDIRVIGEASDGEEGLKVVDVEFSKYRKTIFRSDL